MKYFKKIVAVFFAMFSLAGLAFAETYQYQLKWGTPGTGNGEFNYASSVAVAPSGHVYVTDHSNHRIQKFDMNGGYIGQWGSAGPGEGQFNSPMGIAVDTFGNVYVADTSNNRIQKFNADGGFIRQWGGPGVADGQFNMPFAVSASASGHIYVAEDGNRVQKFDLDGNFIRKWGSSGTGNGQFSAPRGIAADIYGNVYVSEYTNNRVQKFTVDGDYIKQWGTGGAADGQFSMPYGLAADASGSVFVVDHWNGRVQKFDPEGNFITKFGTGGGGDGQLNFPTGVAVNTYGGVYVADMYNHRVQKFYLPVCVTPPSGLVAWWTGDANANDIIGGYNGTLMNGVTFAAAQVEKAFSFDGTDSYVSIPAAAGIGGNGPGTVEFWFKADAIPSAGNYAYLYLEDDSIATPADLRIYLYGSTLNFLGHNGTSYEFALSTSFSDITSWHHVAGVWSAADTRFYLDGVLVGSDSVVDMAAFTPGVVVLGSGLFPNSDFSGSIDEVGLYNRLLSGQEIQAIYSAGAAGKCKPCMASPDGLVSWWAGDDNAQDMAGSNPGMLNGVTFDSGMVGRAFSFNGNGENVSVPASSNWAFGSGDFAIMFWVYGTNFGTQRPLINNRKTPASNSMWAIETYYTGSNIVEFHSGLTIYLIATNPLISSSWNHVAVTRNGGTLSMYINGVLSGTVGNTTDFAEINDLQIGRDVMNGNDLAGSFSGRMDEIQIFNRGLSAAEIASIFDAGSGGICKACTAPPSGMVAWWKGDGDGLDAVGTNHGTPQGGATYDAGKVGQAFSFDGGADFIDAGTDEVFNFDNGTGDFTIDAWINPVSFPEAASGIVAKATQGPYSGWAFYVYNDGRLGFGGVGGWQVTSAAGTITQGNWAHVSVTKSGDIYTLYKNGIAVGSTTRAGALETSATSLRIGTDYSDSLRFQGLIDEIEIFTRALSPGEIVAIYNAGCAGKCFTPDTTPLNFSLGSVSGASPGSGQTTTYTVTGINVAAAISITGGQYAIGGCGGTFTDASGTVKNGDVICVQVTASSSYGGNASADLTIGTETATFSVDTRAPQTLTVSNTGNGSGTVTSDLTGLNCSGSWTCTFGQGDTVTLTATPADAASYFNGWGGDCNTDGQVMLGGQPSSCTASFVRYPVWNDGTSDYFLTIGEAYGDGSTPYTIKAHGVELTDSNLNLSGTAAVVLDGGYQSDFTLGYSDSPTVVTGPLTIGGTGSVVISNVALK